jgi:hypothetical protein
MDELETFDYLEEEFQIVGIVGLGWNTLESILSKEVLQV